MSDGVKAFHQVLIRLTINMSIDATRGSRIVLPKHLLDCLVSVPSL